MFDKAGMTDEEKQQFAAALQRIDALERRTFELEQKLSVDHVARSEQQRKKTRTMWGD